MQELAIHGAVRVFAEKLAAAEPIRALGAAGERLSGDPQAQSLLARRRAAEQTLARKQEQGAASRADIDHLRQVQAQVWSNPTIQSYEQAVENARAFLQAANREITGVLGLDFGALARTGGCC